MHNYPSRPFPSALAGATLPRPAALVFASSTRLALGLIVLLALILRLWGLNFGLPYVIQPDEPSVELRALHMWYAGDLNPHYFVYPSLFYDMQALLAFAVAHVGGLLQPDILRHPLGHLPLFYLAGRALTTMLGTATVLVAYLVGRYLNPRLGLNAALFLAVAPQHVQQSHYITVDAPTALFTALAALFAIRALMQAGRIGDVVLSAVAAGLAAGTKYNAGLALLLPLAAVFLSEQSWKRRLGASAAAAAACVTTFVLTTPFALLDRGQAGRPWPFLNSLQVVSRHYAAGHPGAEGNDNAIWYLQYLGRDGILAPMTILALAGIAVIAIRYRRAGLVLLSFVVAYYALLCSTFVRFDRNLLPLLPFLALLAAAAADYLIPTLAVVLRKRSAAIALVLGVAAAPATAVAARGDYAITHPFSEQVAVEWADAHLPLGSALATENWEGLAFSPVRYRLLNLGSLARQPYSWYRHHHVQYLETDSYTMSAYFQSSRLYPVQVARYLELFRRARLIARIVGDPLLRPGPTVSIYQVQ